MPTSPKTRLRPVLVGECNPYGTDPEFALYPMPEGCAGERLCCLVLGMYKRDYLSRFDRVNLCVGRWDARQARATAAGMSGRTLVLCGSKVCGAFGVPFTPFLAQSESLLVLPHPSGRCRMWNEEGAVQQARAAVSEFLPDLAPLLGRVAH